MIMRRTDSKRLAECSTILSPAMPAGYAVEKREHGGGEQVMIHEAIQAVLGSAALSPQRQLAAVERTMRY